MKQPGHERPDIKAHFDQCPVLRFDNIVLNTDIYSCNLIGGFHMVWEKISLGRGRSQVYNSSINPRTFTVS